MSQPDLDENNQAADGHTVASCLSELRLEALDRKIGEMASQVTEADRRGDLEERDRLVLEQVELTRRRRSLLPRAEAAAPITY